MANKKITGAQFRSEYKKPKAGAFLFYGEENFIKQRELVSIREKLCFDESTEAFNHFIFTRDNYTHEALYSAVMSMPMMSDIKLIELYEIPFSEYKKKEDTDGLESALAAVAENEDTLLIIYTTPENFDAGDGKTPSALMKLFSKYVVPVEFAHETTQRLTLWVQKHFSGEKIIAEPTECVYLIECVGHDMAALTGEIGKLCAYLHYKERDKLEKVDIDLVCPKNKEIGDFEFADSIIDGNNEKSFYILSDMKLKGDAVPVILGSIIRVFTDLYSLKLAADAGMTSDDAAKRFGMHPYVAKLRMAKARTVEKQALEAIISLCSQTDSMLKSSSADNYILIERLIIRASQLRKRKVF